MADEGVILEIQKFRSIREGKWPDVYSLTAAVANNTTFPLMFSIDDDADYLVGAMSGSCYGPTTREGKRILNASTDFPLAGTTVPSGASSAAYADRGLMARITDAGSNLELTNGLVPLETLLTPGYGVAKMPSMPFSHYMLKGSQLRIDVRNRDTAVGPASETIYHTVTFTFYGHKYKG